ncbi:MAG: glycoside hydrolase family 20 zincin-like fold domain-containing protein [Candidatus Fervidibacter sp.]|uniref:glycoside hydrolase family 20 zincin-like fold domain-containing protein n=1 Tax=Candidatus Fervidibacter sp. TaxID=3100871 RepID=UPI00404B074B
MRKEVDNLSRGLTKLGKAGLTFLLVSSIASLSSALGDEEQSVSEKQFEWHWGSWKVTAAKNEVVVRRHQAKVLILFPPLDLTFKEGRRQGPIASLKFEGSSGSGVWFLGLTVNGLNLVAQHTLQPQGVNSWRWAIFNPNLLRGAARLPSSDEWSGMTIFGPVTINVGGIGARAYWKQTADGLTAELVYSTETKILRSQLEVRLPPHWLLAGQPTGNAVVHPIDLVQGEYWDLPLIPKPKWLRWGNSSFRFGRQVPLFVAEESFRKAAENLRIYLQTRFLRQVTLRTWSPDLPLERGIVFAPQNSPLGEQATELEPTLRAELPPQGYALAASPQGVWILAADPDGAFGAVQTLKQLIRLTDDGAVIVPEVFIRDHPDFAFRGVHFVIDDFSPQLHRRLIEQVWAPLKFNKLIVQVDHLKWESHPELWQPWSLSKGEAKQLKQIADDNNMEVIPLLPTLSHCEYLFGSLAGRPPQVNKECAEDPETAYLYCPNLEQTYRIVFDLMEELLELFNPRWVHIGHDEVTSREKFGSCIRCQGMLPHFLFAADVKRLYEFLKSRGVNVMMWGDMLLRPDEAYDAAYGGPPHNFWKARELIPKDIMIVDWHYQPAPRYPSIDIFKREGFEVVGATWRNFRAIVEFTRAAKRSNALGMVQTTWTGFGNNKNALFESPDQFASYIVAAEQFWNANESAPARGYSAQSIFETMFREATVQPMSGFVVDLSPIANLTIAKLLSVPPSQISGTRRRLNRRLFWLAEDRDGTIGVVALKGAWLTGAPDEVVLTIGEPAIELTFVHATDIPVPEGTHIGGYEIMLGGDEKIAVQLRYGYQIRALSDDRPLRDSSASFAWRWTTGKGKISLTALSVPLKSDRVVQQIRFYSANEEAAPLLVSLTGVSQVSVPLGAP